MTEPAPARRRDINSLAVLIVLIALVLAGSYYWFIYRPASIRSNCAASTGVPLGNPYGEPTYVECVRSHGLSN